MLGGTNVASKASARRNSKGSKTRKESKDRAQGIVSGQGNAQTVQHTTRNSRSISNRDQLPFATNNIWKDNAVKTIDSAQRHNVKRSNSNGKNSNKKLKELIVCADKPPMAVLPQSTKAGAKRDPKYDRAFEEEFEKLYKKDIEKFIDGSDFEVESLAGFSEMTNGTFHTVGQEIKRRDLEKVYLQRLEF